MPPSKPPIVILAGSDRRPIRLPRRGRDRHPLEGYKGIDVKIGDRTLDEAVADRLQQTGRFGPLYLVGPSASFASHRSAARLIDSDGTFGENIRSAVEFVGAAHPQAPLAVITCDVLPDVEMLRSLMEDYDRHAPCDLWFPLIHAPEDRGSLGASDWKPAYRIVPREGVPAVPVLPGHLAVADPAALRLSFLYRLFELGYRTRNRSIDDRRGVMVRGVMRALVVQDLLHLVALRAPTLTWSVLSVGLATARELRDGTITRARLEQAVRRICVTSRHRRKYPERRVLLPIVEGLSLALDIDTEEEARAAGGDLRRGPGPGRVY